MNVVKLNQYFDVYASISNNQIYLFNQRKVILQSIPVDFNLYPGSSCMNYCYGKECIFDAKLHNLIYCENHIYVQCYEKILELTEKLTLEYIASIPDLTLSTPAAFYGRVFTMQGKLYAHNYNGSQSYSGMLYVLVDNRFKEVKEMPGSFFCFCDNVYVWDYKGFNLYKLTNELELITIINIIDKENQYVTWSNGVLIIYTGDGSYLMLNMLTSQLQYLNNQVNIKLFLGQYSNQLEDQCIDNAFGQGSAEQIRQAQMSLQFKSIFQYADQCFDAYYFKNMDQYRSIQNRTLKQMKLVNNSMQRIVQQYNLMSLTYLNSINNQDQ
ncbi:Conserved_hypothetical protein [Hexamita inflata]|uniref:Uncharacterized protein n=1 Tax=Hexamita inflata TaxID=28002 RepID=A0AA86PLD0_9EUKA|nr:Conserved hypothetical protein [Hexamita inflata]